MHSSAPLPSCRVVSGVHSSACYCMVLQPGEAARLGGGVADAVEDAHDGVLQALLLVAPRQQRQPPRIEVRDLGLRMAMDRVASGRSRRCQGACSTQGAWQARLFWATGMSSPHPFRPWQCMPLMDARLRLGTGDKQKACLAVRVGGSDGGGLLLLELRRRRDVVHACMRAEPQFTSTS